MYKAKFTTKSNFRNVLSRTIKKSCNIKDLKSEKLSHPPLLQRDDPMGLICFDSSNVPFSLLTRIEICTANERAKMCFHEHHRTCRKGFHGRCRCRFAKKSGISNGTKCVLLQPKNNRSPLPVATSLDSSTAENEANLYYDAETELRTLYEANNNGQQESESKEDESDKYKYDVQTVPSCQNPVYALRSPLIRTNDAMIVWELDRPIPSLGEIPQLQSFSNIDDLINDAGNGDEHTIRTKIGDIFQYLLEHEEGTVGQPFCQSLNGSLWDFLKNHSIKAVHELFRITMKALKTANQYVVEHNPVLSLCTGSHNNAVLLGGAEQAKSATFYIAPYMAKEKASLVVCLTVLEKARREALTYRSRAGDRDTRPQERLAKHFLTKVANKLNAHVELSDYQVSAYLLSIPSIITSEVFQYTEPHGAANYREKLLHEMLQTGEENGNSNFGYVRTFTCEADTSNTGNKLKMAVPVVAMYYHRGQKLNHLSLYEFDSIIQVKKLPNDDTKSRSTWFKFEGGFELQAGFGMTLCRKQKTLIFKGASPRHPGEEPPENDAKFKQWKRKADVFARYILTMFRPSRIYRGKMQKLEDTQTLNLDQDWEELQSWISQLQRDESVVSKFRLMAMDRRMNLLISNHTNKKILSDYRARDADLWTTQEKGFRNQEERMQRRFEMEDLRQLTENDSSEEAQYQPLSSRSAKTGEELHQDAIALSEAANTIDDPSTSRWSTTHETGTASIPIEDYNDSDEWDRKCEWVYNDKYLDDDNSSCDSYRTCREEESEDENWDNNEVDAATTVIDTTNLNPQQREVVSIYANYLAEDNVVAAAKPPPVVLLTGIGGTGKSYVINKLLEYGKANHDKFQTVLTTANNNLNAADIDGSTIASILKQTFSEKKKDNNESTQRRLNPFAISDLQKMDVKRCKMLIIDEISIVPTEKLGQLSRVFAFAMEKEDLFFGGIPVLLVGDFNQKEPIGELATSTLLKYVQQEVCDIQPNSEQGPNQNGPVPQQTTHQHKKNIGLSSDNALGCNILSNAKWFELTIAQRSDDTQHNEFNAGMYKGLPIHLPKFHMYDLYDKSTLDRDPPEERKLWSKAPVIVRTNKERVHVNYGRAKEFAIYNKTYLFKWQCNYDNWEGKPISDEATGELVDHDPSFWETFVVGGPCYLIDTISKKKKLCNGTRAEYHSIVLGRQGIDEFEEQSLRGSIIVLSEPPHGINILITDKMVLGNENINWKEFQDPNYQPPIINNETSEEEENEAPPVPIIIPIRMRKTKPSAQAPTFVISPSHLVRPAKVKVYETFPIRGGFAITVDKAQGQTLDRVIVALSQRKHTISNFTYPCVYVSNSRVRHSNHLRLLLNKETNKVVQWQSLVYLTTLKKNKSIDSFFAGFDNDRDNWSTNEWDKERALNVYNGKE